MIMGLVEGLSHGIGMVEARIDNEKIAFIQVSLLLRTISP